MTELSLVSLWEAQPLVPRVVLVEVGPIPAPRLLDGQVAVRAVGAGEQVPRQHVQRQPFLQPRTEDPEEDIEVLARHFFERLQVRINLYRCIKPRYSPQPWSASGWRL